MFAFYTEFLDMLNYNSTEYNKTHAQNLFTQRNMNALKMKQNGQLTQVYI